MSMAPDDLFGAVRDVAIVALLARHWPGPGARHAMVGPLAGFLLQARLDPARVVRIIKVAATIAKDPDVQDRVDFANSTAKTFAAGSAVTGGPKLAEELGEDVVAKMRTWLKGVDEDALVLDPRDPMRSARLFIEREHTMENVMALRHQAGVFYRYEGAYHEREEARLRAELYRFLEPAQYLSKEGIKPFKPTKSKVENILDALRGLTNLPASQASPCWLHPADLDARDLLACRNGLLHLPTRTLHPLTPHFFALNALDFDYDPNAPNPEAWLDFLAQLPRFSDDDPLFSRG